MRRSPSSGKTRTDLFAPLVAGRLALRRKEGKLIDGVLGEQVCQRIRGEVQHGLLKAFE